MSMCEGTLLRPKGVQVPICVSMVEHAEVTIRALLWERYLPGTEERQVGCTHGYQGNCHGLARRAGTPIARPEIDRIGGGIDSWRNPDTAPSTAIGDDVERVLYHPC